jgi:hypothetical protein
MSQRATAWLCWLPRRSGAGVVIVGASGQTMRTTVVLVSGSINSMLGASPPLLLSDQCAPPRPVRLLERRNFQDRRCGWTRLPTTARLAADLPSGRSTRPEALAVCQRRGAGVPVRRLDSRSVMTHLGGAGVSYSVLGLLLAPYRKLLLRCVPDGALPGHRRSPRHRRSRRARRTVQPVPHNAPARASSLRHAQADDLGLTSRRKQRGPAGGSPAVMKIASPVWGSASSMGAGRHRRWMPDMLASSPTCSVEGLMDDLA